MSEENEKVELELENNNYMNDAFNTKIRELAEEDVKKFLKMIDADKYLQKCLDVMGVTIQNPFSIYYRHRDTVFTDLSYQNKLIDHFSKCQANRLASELSKPEEPEEPKITLEATLEKQKEVSK